MRYLITVLLISFVVILGVGSFLKNPRQTTMTVLIPAPIEIVWDKITGVEDQTAWRSDIKEIKIESSGGELKIFTEISVSSPSTTFRETIKESNQRYRIDIIPNQGFSGYSTIDLTQGREKVAITFLEVSNIKNPLRRILPYIFYDPAECSYSAQTPSPAPGPETVPL